MWLLIFLLFGQASPPQHQATLYYQNSSCTTATPCALQVYRAVCSSPTNCPGWGNGAGWTRVSFGAGSASPTATGTTWVLYDQDPALKSNTTYIYVATNSYQSSPATYSPRSPTWIGTTGAGGGSAPATPTVGVGNTVN